MSHSPLRLFLLSLLLSIFVSTSQAKSEFLEIREFSPLHFTEDVLQKDSQAYFKGLLGTIKSYVETKKKVRIKVLGHSNARVDIYDKVIAGEEAYKKTLKNTVVLAQKIVQDLIASGLTYDEIDIDYKNSKNLGFTNLTSQGRNLSNHVVVTMYVLAPESLISKVPSIKLPEIKISKDTKKYLPEFLVASDTYVEKVEKIIAKPILQKSIVKPKVEIKPILEESIKKPEVKIKSIQIQEIKKEEVLITKPIVAVVKVQDSDNDGILDNIDSEAKTPFGYKVDSKGRAISISLAVSYAKNSIKLPENFTQDIMKLAKYLTQNPSLKADIVGHTSKTAVSDMIYNIRLSLKRAKAFKEELKKYGIETKRLSTDGKGYSMPVADNQTQEGRIKNRRLEIEIRRNK